MPQKRAGKPALFLKKQKYRAKQKKMPKNRHFPLLFADILTTFIDTPGDYYPVLTEKGISHEQE